MQIDATIFGGLPVVVELTEQPAEPDVGILESYFEIDAIYTTRVRKRDRRLIKNPIPDSWWEKLSRTGEMEELAVRVAATR